MSQRMRKSLVETEPLTPQRSTPQRASRIKTEPASTTPQRAARIKTETVSITPQRATRRSIVKPEAVADVKISTPSKRTRSSSVSSILSDVSDVGSESGRVTRRSSRLSGIKVEDILEQPAELLGRKRTSSISSVTSETPSQNKPTTRKSTSAKETPSQSTVSSLDAATPCFSKNRLLEGSKHEDSPFKVSSTRKSRKLSLPTVDEDEVAKQEEKEEAKATLSTKQLEEIHFSSDNDEDEVEISGKKRTVDRKRKSILPARNDQLNTIDEDECEIANAEGLEINTTSNKNSKSPIKEISPSVMLNRIDSTDVSPSLILDKMNDATKTPVTSKSSTQVKPPATQTSKSPAAQISKSPASQTSKSPAAQTSKSPAAQISKSATQTSKSPDTHISKSPAAQTSKSPAEHTSKSPATPIMNKQKSKEIKQLLSKAEESPTDITGKKHGKSNNNKIGDDSPKTDIISTDNLKRKSKDRISDNTTPKKSLGKASSNNSMNAEDHESPPISVEEITLDDDNDGDIIMENDSNPPTSEQVEMVTQNNSRKRKSKSHSEIIEATQTNSKKRKSQDTPKVIEKANKNEEDDENKENNHKSTNEDNSDIETEAETLKRLRLEKAKSLLDSSRQRRQKKKKNSEREKRRLKERRLRRQLKKQNVEGLNEKLVKNAIKPKEQKEANCVKETRVKVDKLRTNLDSVDEQKRLEKILAKKALKRQKWIKRLAEKKKADKAKKMEEKHLAKTERKKIHEEAAVAKADLKAKMTKKRRTKKKKSALGTVSNGKTGSKDDGSSNELNISLSDILAKFDEMSQSKKSKSDEAKKVLAELNDTDDKSDDISRGKAKSGRWWKDTKDKFSTMVKTPGLRRPHSEKERLRADIKHNKEMTRNILETAARAKEEHRQRRLENIKRRDENAKKAEIVQVIKNPAKLKRMKKKQLRLIEKRDTLPIIEKRKAAALQSMDS